MDTPLDRLSASQVKSSQVLIRCFMLKTGRLALLRRHELGDDVNPNSDQKGEVLVFLLLAVW